MVVLKLSVCYGLFCLTGSQVLRFSGLGAAEARRQDRLSSGSRWPAPNSTAAKAGADFREASTIIPPWRRRRGGITNVGVHHCKWPAQQDSAAPQDAKILHANDTV